MSNDQWGLKPIQSPWRNSLTDYFRPNEESIALRIFPPKVFECWAGLAARQHKLRRKKK